MKTGTDADVGLINLSSTTPTTIASLVALPAPATLPQSNRIQPTETTQFVLNATLTQYVLESDSDYHLVLEDASGNTMIVEIPSPSCVGAGSPFASGIQSARATMDAKFTVTSSFQTTNTPVQITGIGFFDFLHGQTGVAPNGIEIHAVLGLIFNPSGANFTISGPPALNVNTGSSVTGTITTAATGGFNSAIVLSASGMPSGVTASFSPSSIAAPGTGSSSLTLTAASSTVAGTYAIKVTGSGNGVTNSTTVSLVVASSATPSFTLTAPGSLPISAGSSGSGTITTSVAGGFNSAISLSATGLPTGVSASFSPATIAAPGSGSSTVTYTVGSTVSPGTYNTTVGATGAGITHSASVTLSITGSGGGGTNNVILDGGFESATVSGDSAPSWTGASSSGSHTDFVVNGSYPHSGKNYAYFGSTNSETDQIAQTVQIPSNATAASLQFWVNIVTTETSSTVYDKLSVRILNPSGSVLSTPLVLSNANSGSDSNTSGVYFQPAAINLLAYAGQTIQVQFYGTTDSLDPTSFRVDDVTLNVTTPGGSGAPPAVSITAPLNGANVSGTVTVTATASGNPSVSSIALLIDGAQVTSNSNSPSLTYSWNTTLAPNGTHTLQAQATNSSGTSNSAVVSVTVNNGGSPQQLIVDPGFESGATNYAPWVFSDAANILNNTSSEPAHSGSWDAWLDGYGSAHTDTVYQQVAIPSTVSTATLTFWLHIDTAETTKTTAYDTLTFQIQNGSGSVLATPQTWSNLNAASGYSLQTFNLSQYKGQTIRIYFKGTEDSTLQTSFVLDDFALNVQ